ncbi:hypothetical protein MPL3356_390149 [Mesorhizobium plurifarium]|uniref:Transmembrane protein n=1 Tax=Mesorhizobium plurifarium TaxID=69974 RepID=A0A090E591_MESPL|nr:hypothetical protein MPL3356_390149 [Mesorhizobium plurifarium]
MGGFWKNGAWAVYALFAIFGLIGFLMWFTYHWDFWDLCSASIDGNGAVCFREWFGASAGYLAVLVGVFTIYPLYRQIEEQRKQTDFQLGDALPTMDITLDLEDQQQIVVRVVNWNRRGLLIWDLEIQGDEGMRTGVMEYKIDNAIVRDPAEYYVRGWEDRSRGPHVAQFKLAAEVNGRIVDAFSMSTQVSMLVQLFGEQHKQMVLRAKLFPQEELLTELD